MTLPSQAIAAGQNITPIISCLLLSGHQSATVAHAGLLYQDYPGNCLSCHAKEAQNMSGSTHYQWMGDAPDMVNEIGIKQGKLTNAVNSYCINITGDWQLCGKCHAGRGLRPDDAGAGLENIDCLVCHSEEYAKVRTRLPDGSMGVVSPTDSMVQNVHKTTRLTCLKCHATAGGGDGVKRGDLSMATSTNADPNFDVHMNTSGNNLTCQACHQFKNHKTLGKGSDLRATDDIVRGSEISCTTCHTAMATTGHTDSTIDRHAARGKIACQVCHIATYAKVATETQRDWRTHEDGTDATTCDTNNPCPGPPFLVKAPDLIPKYKWWNRKSDNYLLGDDASRTFDTVLTTYPTSRPLGNFDLNDTTTKIYPFKYKTAIQPKTVGDNRLVALDTLIYLGGTGNVTEAIESGLVNMGYQGNEAVEWITTDTYQLLNHGVEPAEKALSCDACHSGSTGLSISTRMPFAELGYHDFRSQDLCTLCHDSKSATRVDMHNRHVRSEGYACNACHGIGAPLKDTKYQVCVSCHDDGIPPATTQKIHTKHVTEEHYPCSTCHTF